MNRRIGQDKSFIPLMLGPVGWGVPVWLPLVIVYFATVFGLGWLWPDFRAATLFAAIGPGLIGLLDLVLRLRTGHYRWHHPQAGEVVTKAGLMDRLTFQECGWYLPIVVLPLPLWVVGLGLSAVFLKSWGLL